jgi:uncharacterized protein (TIGR03382 family)
VKITFTTGPAPVRNYGAENVVAVWIEGPVGTYRKTIGEWVQIRQAALVAWQAALGGKNDVDVVTNASRNTENTALTAVWNLKDYQGNLVPDGTYQIRLELAQSNSVSTAANNEGTFTFTKGATPLTLTNQANGGFTNVTIEFNPTAVTCADGTFDAPEEKCDYAIKAGMPGACPTACAAEDACTPLKLQGDATTCSAECVADTPITACVNGDGCCADGCTGANDNDCLAGGGGGPGEISGGCETGSGAGGALAFGALGLALLLGRRRR